MSAEGWQYVGPIRCADGYCTVVCRYDANGACVNCGCLNPERFVVIDFPTEQEALRMKVQAELEDYGIEVHWRVHPDAADIS